MKFVNTNTDCFSTIYRSDSKPIVSMKSILRNRNLSTSPFIT